MITSSSNEKIKNIRKLRNRKYREENGLYFIEGSRIVIEALDVKAKIQELIYTQGYVQSDIGSRVIEKAIAQNCRINEVSDEVFGTLSQKDNPQGVGAVLKQQWTNPDFIKNKISGIWLGLVEIADPGNLGTIIRTCDATGINGIILIGNCTDPYDPTALRASMGGVFTKELVRIKQYDFIGWVKERKIPLIGTSDSAEMDYREYAYPENMILIMGSEREGLPEQIERACTSIVSISMKGGCDSLNLAVATGVVLYEILYQHVKIRTEKGSL